MVWRIKYGEKAKKNIAKLDRAVGARIDTFLEEKVAKSGDPRSIGEALKGEKFKNLWKYRVGDYRVVAEIQDDILMVLVVRIGHRRNVYD